MNMAQLTFWISNTYGGYINKSVFSTNQKTANSVILAKFFSVIAFVQIYSLNS